MHRAFGGFALLICAGLAGAQAPAAPPQPAGIPTEWEIGAILGEIGAHYCRLTATLNRIDAAAWTRKGASETYAEQLEAAKGQARAIEAAAKALAGNPEKLSAELELLFRIDGVGRILQSVEEVMRKYQSPEDAQRLAAEEAENGANGERLRSYVIDVAAQRERQFAMLDGEVQRCRESLVSQPAPPRKK
jgi:hypothetical protein